MLSLRFHHLQQLIYVMAATTFIINNKNIQANVGNTLSTSTSIINFKAQNKHHSPSVIATHGKLENGNLQQHFARCTFLAAYRHMTGKPSKKGQKTYIVQALDNRMSHLRNFVSRRTSLHIHFREFKFCAVKSSYESFVNLIFVQRSPCMDYLQSSSLCSKVFLRTIRKHFVFLLESLHKLFRALLLLGASDRPLVPLTLVFQEPQEIGVIR